MDKSILNGIIDTHIHTAPDPYTKRRFDDFEIAKQTHEYKARCIVIKSHAMETAARAQLVNKEYDDLDVFGGITLNQWVGGFNPYAVDAAIHLGGKIVWLPTLSSLNDRESKGKRGGLYCLDTWGHVRAELVEILKLIADADIILATGHIDYTEMVAVVDKAKEVGVKKIIVNHPELFRTKLTVEQQLNLTQYDVYFERTFGMLDPMHQHMPIALENIQKVGAASTILATDVGQVNNLDWSDAYFTFMKYLLEHGISQADMEVMTKTNQKKLLGLA
ncbi:DUF6282 family protein [Acidaminococcus provencensis]|jgi:hypothetical protein|uniref:DUF6282 family protein n=1 Tax=Acidaminococcus provencensis TaxID=2058289 RepID=UPI000CFA4125|nr:DUF6282 family protein [Acidaminococcus provencensis]